MSIQPYQKEVWTHVQQPHQISHAFLSAVRGAGEQIPGTNLSFAILTRKEALRAAFRLRYEVFCEQMHVLQKDDYPDGLEVDGYDQSAVHTAILEEGEIVAYTRLVLPSDNVFPLEKEVTLPKIFDRKNVVEVSRALVVKRKRREASGLIWHLFNGIYRMCQKGKLEAILSFSNEVMYNGYVNRGVPLLHVGDHVFFHGHKSYPLVIEVRQDHLGGFDIR